MTKQTCNLGRQYRHVTTLFSFDHFIALEWAKKVTMEFIVNVLIIQVKPIGIIAKMIQCFYRVNQTFE